MISSFRLSSFKSFKEMEKLSIKPITVVLGKNSCGKSTLIQSLLLLKQTIASSTDTALCLDGKYMKFPNIREISTGLPRIDRAKIGYEIDLEFLEGGEQKNSNISISIKNKKSEAGQYRPIVDKFSIKSDVYGDHLFKIPSDQVIREILEERVSKEFAENIEKIGPKKLGFKKFVPDTYDLTLHMKDGDELYFPFPLFLMDGYYLPKPDAPGDLPFGRFEKTSFDYLETALKNIKYLSPLRAAPQRDYIHYSQDVTELHEDGSNAAHVLWSKRDQQVKWKKKKQSLVDAVNKCIDCMGLSQSISPDVVGDILYKVSVTEGNSNKKVSLADVGFGYSQVLPIILLGLLNGPKNLMLLEQPEIHLHPSSAANLADLFINFSRDNKKFMIETHSQEFINRLRLRVIEDPSLKDKINIVFIEKDGDELSDIDQFSIDENGMFPKWPNGFLDESQKIAQAILDARLAKREKLKKKEERVVRD